MIITVIAGMLVMPALWFPLKPYQKKRVLEFLPVTQRKLLVRTLGTREKEAVAVKIDPNDLRDLDELLEEMGGGWNSEQSIIAVGSGGLAGKGWRHGTQARLAFLPESHTDFIFPVLCEEFGFLGSAFVIALYFVLLTAGYRISSQAVDNFGRLLASGISVMLAAHIVINVSMTIGLMPITGLPLPLMSYGGSSLLMVMLSLGILQSIHARKSYFSRGRMVIK